MIQPHQRHFPKSTLENYIYHKVKHSNTNPLCNNRHTHTHLSRTIDSTANYSNFSPRWQLSRTQRLKKRKKKQPSQKINTKMSSSRTPFYIPQAPKKKTKKKKLFFNTDYSLVCRSLQKEKLATMTKENMCCQRRVNEPAEKKEICAILLFFFLFHAGMIDTADERDLFLLILFCTV